MAQIKLSSKITSSSMQKQSVRNALSRLIGNIAYESAMQARRKIPRDFKLKRRWIVQGIRFERPKSGFIGKVFSLDALMEKHEDGTNFHNQALIQSRNLQRRGRLPSDRPSSLLSRHNYFINERGIFERRPDKRLRSWYHYVPSRHYSKRLQLKDTVQQMASLMVHDASRYMVIQ